MDTLTHTVIGICAGELIAGKQLGKKAMLYGALANNIPDMDVVSYFFMKPENALLAHRGFFHSILFAILFAPICALVFKRIYRNNEATFNRWLLLFGSGILIHIFIDGCTAYGTGMLEPFSHKRISFNTMFIIDPFFTIPMLIGAIVLIALNKNSLKRTLWAKSTLAVSTLYLIFGTVNKLYVDHIVEKNLTSQHITFDDYTVTPAPLSNLLWYIAARNGGEYYTGYYSLLDANSFIRFKTISRNDSLLNGAAAKSEIESLTRFANGYYSVEKDSNNSLIMNFIRFGEADVGNSPKTTFAFVFVVQRGSNSNAIQPKRFGKFNNAAFGRLMKRIEGVDQTKL